MQSARKPLGRVARGALFAAGAVALTECSSMAPQPMYGAACIDTDACGIPQQDASKNDASDAGDAAPDASADATID